MERSVAMQLCPTATNTLRGEPCLPSRACKYLSGLTGSDYRACREAASRRPAQRLSRLGGSTRAACFDGPHAPSDEGDRTVSGSCDVHTCGPGAPSLAVSGRHEGAGEGTVPECSRVADQPLR